TSCAITSRKKQGTQCSGMAMRRWTREGSITAARERSYSRIGWRRATDFALRARATSRALLTIRFPARGLSALLVTFISLDKQLLTQSERWRGPRGLR